ncbi:uncharacterized protein BYT42DRAFT_78883 [Radiomyces spectabilis]|uniref:uncharacterized protein n=1 Tax=Radiomyces spectabilis TaxID=64574 RepID=UPI0022212258|nr:uncharacterized protein BYT42DRAFT_78883 [Radiomyces spectabilis]KAI8371723.1 hypothetical protein BYT42DRAFT_78883 [Radiomyces spectabilis]
MYGDIDYTIRALSAADARELNVTLRYGVHNGVIWCIAASDHHLYIASTSSDGAVKIAENTTRHKRRQPRHQTVYELKLEANGSFRYMDGFPVQYATSEKDISLSLSLVNPLQSIHKAAWNPNLKAAGWLVTGGPAGLCRLEFIGCGPTLDNK